MKTAIVTGATSGIGRATALKLAEIGYRIIVTGRRVEKLETLKKEIVAKFNKDVFMLPFDVQDKAQVETAFESLPENWRKIDVLVNNAGLAAGLSPINDSLDSDWEQMINTNIKGLLYVTKIVSKIMILQGYGHIVNIGSIAGVQVYENGSVYCATKHAVNALSKGMRIDLLKHGIKVTEIRPGLAETEFSIVRFKGDVDNAKKPYVGLIPLSGNDVAETIVFALSRPKHVNINEIEITPTAQANSIYVFRK